MDRLTDKRFIGKDFYEPKNREERLDIFANIPSLLEIYTRLAEYEDTGLTPDEIKNMKVYCENTGCIYYDADNQICTLKEISHDDVGVCVSVRWDGGSE